MSRKWGLIISASQSRHAGMAGPSHGDTDAQGLAAIWKKTLGDNLITCMASDATVAVVQARFKAIQKLLKPGDLLFLFLAGRLFSVKGKLFLCCWDTLPDDPIPTSVLLNDWLTILDKAKAAKTILFIDPIFNRNSDDAIPELSLNHVSVFQSCDWEEQSFSQGTPARGIWTSLMIDCFAGKIGTALDRQGALTTQTLAKAIQKEFPRKLRQKHGPGVSQSPFQYGSDEIVELANFADSQQSELNDNQLKRMIFRGEYRSRIRDLIDYRKNYSLPDRVSASSNKFFARLAIPEIQADLEQMYQSIIQSFGYKRKDVHVATDRDGFGTIRTPDFEYCLSLELAEDDPTTLIWSRDITQIQELETIRTTAFEDCFSLIIDQVIFEFETPRVISDWIDVYEDSPWPGSRLTTGPNAEWCEVRLKGFQGSIRIESHQFILKGRSGGLKELLSMMSKCGDLFTGAGL